ncbi:hypothetical protein Tco_1073949 [Tanacetum coccineum]
MSEKAKDPEVIAKKISHKPIDYENLNSLTDDFEKRFSPEQELSDEQAFWFHILNPSIEFSYTPPVIVEVPSELPKVSLVNASLKKLNFHLTQFDYVVKKRTTPNDLEEASMQLQQEVFQNDESCVNQNTVKIQEYFEINDLKARLQNKDKTICKLKDTIKYLRENTKEENVNPDKCDLEPINKEMENSVAKLLSENELEQAKAKQPLDSELDFACKYAIRIQELLVYVQDTCPNAITPSTKKVVVTLMKNVKKVSVTPPFLQYSSRS